jgi:hypothetical protein
VHISERTRISEHEAPTGFDIFYNFMYNFQASLNHRAYACSCCKMNTRVTRSSVFKSTLRFRKQTWNNAAIAHICTYVHRMSYFAPGRTEPEIMNTFNAKAPEKKESVDIGTNGPCMQKVLHISNFTRGYS